MEQFISECFSIVLEEDLAKDLAAYIMTVENETDFDDYMKGLLELTNPQEKKIYKDIKAAKFGNKFKKAKETSPISDGACSVLTAYSASRCESRSSDTGFTKGKKSNKKKYSKFDIRELQKGYKKEGRQPCECQATEHKLINNCLDCGRIVCEQEGSGPCFFCDSMVCTKEEEEILNSSSREADALYNVLTERKKSEAWKKAMEARNRLLEFDKMTTKVTKIIDDEHDYFNLNNTWDSKTERETKKAKFTKAQEKKHASKLGTRKITLDFLEKKAFEENENQIYEEDVLESEQFVLKENDEMAERRISYEKKTDSDIDNILTALKNDKSNFVTVKEGILNETESFKQQFMKNYIIQDKTYLEMTDKGMCLSMHQPWASLLLLGIKKHEGRTWYSPHRGLLWIASTNKQVDPQLIKETEDFYRKYYEGMEIQFPKKYPTGSLLGNVLLQDVLSHDEYIEMYPHGESDSPFVFICSDPNKLTVPIPMKGDHKIYKLHPKTHTMAKDALKLKKRFAK